jgi:hypothetical protein
VPLGGVYSGFYKITVTAADGSIPERYNSQTELGVEVGPNVPAVKHAVQLDLKK